MEGTLIPKVKICCIASLAEATTAINLGASAIGLVGHMPSGPGIISDSLIKQIAKEVPPSIASFLLTSETTTKGIIAHHKKVLTNTIQMVDSITEGHYDELRKLLPDVKLIQVIHVVDEVSVQEAIDVSHHVDAILLDSGNPNLQIKELGGTGKVHNWDLSKRIREEIDIPLFLAGGLNASNVGQAIKHVQPYGIDLCSGVRTEGKLDIEKLTAFFSAIRKASIPL